MATSETDVGDLSASDVLHGGGAAVLSCPSSDHAADQAEADCRDCFEDQSSGCCHLCKFIQPII